MPVEPKARETSFYIAAGLGEEDKFCWMVAGEYCGCVGAHIEYDVSGLGYASGVLIRWWSRSG